MADASETTLIRNTAWLVAWDAANKRHVYLRDADIAFRSGEIVHVGPGFTGKAERVIDGSRRLVIPGLINVHTHPTSEPLQGVLLIVGLYDGSGKLIDVANGITESKQLGGNSATGFTAEFRNTKQVPSTYKVFAMGTR